MKTNIIRKYFESMSDFENWNDATEDKDNIVTIIEEGGWYRVDLTTYCARPSTAIRRLFAQLRDINDFTGWEECMIESVQSNYWHMNDMTMSDGSKNPYPGYSFGVEQLWEKTEESPAYWYVFINIMTDAERERVADEMKKEFQAVFQLSKTEIFEVRYYHLSTNRRADFATSAARFCRNKKDFSMCGQAQKTICKGHRAAYNFYRKWDKKHLQDLTSEEYRDMRSDLENLKEKYNFIYEELDESKRPYSPHFSFYRLAEWTKQTPKKEA